MSFCDEQRTRVASLWDPMLAHPFLLGLRDGTLPDDVFIRWLRQDYLFVRESVPFLGALLAKAPYRHIEALADAIGGLRGELRLFREQAAALGLTLDDVAPSFINHAYQQFLLATSLRASYAEAYTVFYVVERAYHEAWTVVRHGISARSRWLPFVENWASDDFGRYVAQLQAELDRLAAGAGEAERDSMAAYFELTTRYEIAFWEMALRGEEWPGVPG